MIHVCAICYQHNTRIPGGTMPFSNKISEWFFVESGWCSVRKNALFAGDFLADFDRSHEDGSTPRRGAITCRYSVPGQAFSRCFSLKSLAVSKSSPDCMHAHNPVRYLRITAQMACIFLFPRPTSEL